MSQDWFQDGRLVEFFLPPPRQGRGVCAAVPIPAISDDERVVLGVAPGRYLPLHLTDNYSLTIRDGKIKKHVDLKVHWTGLINHASHKRTNAFFSDQYLLLRPHTKIDKGDEILIDYSLDYWVWFLTYYDIEDWKKCKEVRERSEQLFTYMHENVDDYSLLLSMKLHTKKWALKVVLDMLEDVLTEHYGYSSKKPWSQ